jgi:hypothetical protein
LSNLPCASTVILFEPSKYGLHPPFIGGQAAKQRDILLFSYVFLLLSFNGSLWQPIERHGEKLWNLAHWFRTVPLSHDPNLWLLAHEL